VRRGHELPAFVEGVYGGIQQAIINRKECYGSEDKILSVKIGNLSHPENSQHTVCLGHW